MIDNRIGFECDKCGEVERVRRLYPCASLAAAEAIGNAAAALLRRGWTFRRDRDLCPECSAAKAAKDAEKGAGR